MGHFVPEYSEHCELITIINIIFSVFFWFVFNARQCPFAWLQIMRCYDFYVIIECLSNEYQSFHLEMRACRSTITIFLLTNFQWIYGSIVYIHCKFIKDKKVHFVILWKKYRETENENKWIQTQMYGCPVPTVNRSCPSLNVDACVCAWWNSVVWLFQHVWLIFQPYIDRESYEQWV